MNLFYEKIQTLMKSKGIKSLNDLAINHLGYESSQKLNRLKKDGNKPSYDILKDFYTAFPDVPMDWYFSDQTDLEISNKVDKSSEAALNHLRREVNYLKRLKELHEDQISYLEEQMGDYGKHNKTDI